MSLENYLRELERLADSSMSQSFVSIEIAELKALVKVAHAAKKLRYKHKFDCTIVEANDFCGLQDSLKELEQLAEGRKVEN